MPGLPNLHHAIDLLAMWTEDRVSRAPQPFDAGPDAPLDCWGALPPLPAAPAGPGLWTVPTPHPAAPADDRLVVRVGAATGARRGTAVIVPPWKTRSARHVAGWVALAARAGWDPWLLTPPHHLERTAAGARSGEGFVSLDLRRLRAVFEQLVLEVRMLAAVAAARGPVGVIGLSLGGLGAALAATGPQRLDFAALVAPPADLATVVAETRIGRRYRRLAERAGTRVPHAEALRARLACLDPGARPARADRLFVAAGADDLIVPPSGPVALARAWGVAPRLYARGHLTLLFGCRALRRDLERFLTSSPPAAGA